MLNMFCWIKNCLEKLFFFGNLMYMYIYFNFFLGFWGDKGSIGERGYIGFMGFDGFFGLFGQYLWINNFRLKVKFQYCDLKENKI